MTRFEALKLKWLKWRLHVHIKRTTRANERMKKATAATTAYMCELADDPRLAGAARLEKRERNEEDTIITIREEAE